MRHVHRFHLEPLESRKLLSSAHVATAHPVKPAVVATPVMLNGTLTVEHAKSSTIINEDGSMTTSVSVVGSLGALGAVHGVWSESTDQFGDYNGPDTIQLTARNPKGSFVIAFNNQNPGRATPISHGIGFYNHAQRLSGGTGAFAKSSENGSIEVNVNTSKKTVVSLLLTTANP